MLVPPVGPPTKGQEAVIRICTSCERLIEDDEEYTSYTPERPTTVAPTVYRHKQSCPEPWSRPAPVTPPTCVPY
jgi:hypothetical protein